ncbi:hypothetical protein [Acinetobacter thermotolerans]|uniref:hypothetical protein n=1 Tax=Acinetobacter thermotolerans TaxID=3151487 RepID=UPI00325C2DE6
MLTKDLYFSQLDLTFQLEVVVVNHDIIVNVKNNTQNKNLYFSCYFYSNGIAIFKDKYKKNAEFSLSLDKSIDLSLKIYVRDVVKDQRFSQLVKVGHIFIESEYSKVCLNKIKADSSGKCNSIKTSHNFTRCIPT